MATYTVKAGDNLTKIAKQYGVPISQITGYKSGDPNKINIGEVLTIGSTTPTTAPVPFKLPTATVQSSQTGIPSNLMKPAETGLAAKTASATAVNANPTGIQNNLANTDQTKLTVTENAQGKIVPIGSTTPTPTTTPKTITPTPTPTPAPTSTPVITPTPTQTQTHATSDITSATEGQTRKNPLSGEDETFSAGKGWIPSNVYKSKTGTTTGITGTTGAQSDYITSQADQGNLYQQILNSLQNLRNSPDVESAYNTVTNLEAGIGAGNNAIQTKPIPLEFQQGQMAALQRDYGPQLTAAQGILSKALTGQQQQLSGLQTAAGMVQPTQLPYSNQLVYPFSGMPVSGTTGQTGLTASIPSLAQQVANGQMTIDQANSYLGGTMGLTDQLRQAVLQINPNFNFTQSSASGNTQAQGQQILTQGNTALAALDKLQTDFNSLSSMQTGGIPATNSIANWVADKLGSAKLAEYKTTIADARAQLAGVLTATGALTQTGAESMAMTYLPDNMTPAMFTAKLNAAKTLIQQKIEKFTQSGVQQNPKESGNVITDAQGNVISIDF